MPGARQRDLFEEAMSKPELRPETRAKLAPLLQALLMEAATFRRGRGCEPVLQIEEGGDDQDHA